jgi:hypothetical protein
VAPSRVGRCGARLRHEAGQTVVIFAILLPLLLGLGAIGVDVGYWYVVKKTAQDAADAAALAAARELPDCETQRAEHYGWVNMPEADEIDARCPDDAHVEVNVSARADTFFGRLFGVMDVTVRGRAVAERLDRPGNLAIFAHDEPECVDGHGLEFEGKDTIVNGMIHSNSRFRIGDGPFWAADGTISRNNCPSSVEPHIVSGFGGGQPPDRLPRDVFETLPWPAWFTPAELGWFSSCTYGATTIEVTAHEVITTGPDRVIAHDGTVPSGTYCATESFVLTGEGVRGAMTVLAPTIVVSADDTQLWPYSGTKVLFFGLANADFNSENDGSLDSGGNPDCQPDPGADLWLEGADNRWSGVVFSPCGRVVVSLAGPRSLDGVIVANQVRVDADGFDMAGKSDFQVQTALVE